MLGKALTDALPGIEIENLARAAVGKTPAALDTALRAAKADARRQGVAMSSVLLRRHLGLAQVDPELLRRIAIHEAATPLPLSCLRLEPS